MKVQLLAGALCLASVACGGTVNMVRPSTPHATLVVSVVHGANSDAMFEDVVLVDGREIPVGTGEGGQVTVLVAPGEHDVRLVSLRQEQRLQIYDVSTSAQAPYMRGNNTLLIPTQRIQPTMQLGPTAVASCKHAVALAAKPGETVRASLHYDGAGTCRPEDA